MTDEHYLKQELYDRVADNPEIFEFIQSAILDGLWYWDLENPEHEWMNPRFWELLGYDPTTKQHLSREWQTLIHPDDLAIADKNFEKHLADPAHPYDQIVRYRHADGHTVWVRCRGMAIRDANGKPLRMLGAHSDLTALKRAEEKLRELSSHDDLTGLHNRRALEEHLSWCIREALREGTPLSLIFCDLDHFKRVNDRYGHGRGDELLVAVGNAIHRNCRENDFATRYGGEEFLIVVRDCGVSESIETARRLRGAVASVNLDESPISASAGVATLHVKNWQSARLGIEAIKANLIAVADDALYDAKKRGRDCEVHGGLIDDELVG